jgi:hypothetical protein
MRNKLTKEEFLNKSNKVHKNKYDYSLVEYKDSEYKIYIICKKHGVFELTTQSHFFKKVGCKSCKGRVKTTDDFIKKSKIIHNDKYDYSLVDYTGNKNRIKIICKKHGIFEQVANYHLSGGGCSICGGKNSKTTNDFIECSNLIHNNHYDYSLVDYKNNRY